MSLGRLNVLVGPNGSGKSTLLDVIQFLGDSVRTDLVPALEERDGFDRLCYRGEVPKRIGRAKLGPQIQIKVKAQITSFASEGAPDEYELRFRRIAQGRLWRKESFRFKRTKGQGRRITIEGANVT